MTQKLKPKKLMPKMLKNLSVTLAAVTLGGIAAGCTSYPKIKTAVSVMDRSSTHLQALNGMPLEAIVTRDLTPTVTLRFSTDSHVLDLANRKKLMGFVQNLGQRDLNRLAVFGFADRRGPANYNDSLSNRRAKSVAQWLLDNGIVAEDYSVEGLGELYVPKLSKARMVQVRVKR